MTDSWLQVFVENLLQGGIRRSPLRSLANFAYYMLFSHDGQDFCLLEKEGYENPDFLYSFLKDRPDLLQPLLDTGYVRLPSEQASQPGASLWGVVDDLKRPKYLLIVEFPRNTHSVGPLLRVVLALELALKRSVTPAEKTGVALPVWLQEILPGFLTKKSPILLVAEAGSGKEELGHAFLEEKFGGLDAAVFFHPGRLSQAVQLRELFGDPAGARLGGASPGIPIIQRKEAVVVIQEAGDLDPLVQLRLLALFSSPEPQKLWIFETSRDLEKMVASERFLSGLHKILQKNTIVLPPLRVCLDRLEEEVERLMCVFREKYRRDVSIDAQALEALVDYHWPGNWYELRNTLESAFLMSAENAILKGDLRLGLWETPEDWDGLNLRRHSEAVEKGLLLRAYALHAGNQVQMARALGISRGSLQYKLEKYRFNLVFGFFDKVLW